MPRKKKVIRRANGEGSIVFLKGNRKKPYAVRVTIGKDDNGRRIRKDIGYFETEATAKDFLSMYNLMKKKDKNRLQISDEQAKLVDENLFTKVKNIAIKDTLTFKEIFDILYIEQYQYQKNCKSINSWFKKFNSIQNKIINNITLYDLQSIFDDIKEKGLGSGTLAHMKSIAIDIFKYAVKHQYISRDDDYTDFIDISLKAHKSENTESKKENNKDKRKSFTVDQVRKIMKQNTLESKYALLYIFTGCRPNELLEIDTNKIYLDVDCKDDGIVRKVSYMITGSKTDAGKNRIIPIHNYIKPIITDLLKEHPNYLIIKPCNDIVNTYHRDLFKPLMAELGYDKVPYACRHTFTSLAKLYNMDPFARKRIVGHKSNDLTDDVYTDVFINKLYTEINKIKV